MNLLTKIDFGDTVDVMKTCIVEGCERPAPQQRMCSMHASRLYRHGDVNHESPYDGRSKLREHRTWIEMRHRCKRDYLLKRIKVCKRWRSSFANFYADMGPKPTPGHTIDRINNSKGYSPENCRWATHTENNRNRKGVKLTMELAERARRDYAKGGMSQSEIASEYGVSQGTMSLLLARKIWT